MADPAFVTMQPGYPQSANIVPALVDPNMDVMHNTHSDICSRRVRFFGFRGVLCVLLLRSLLPTFCA